MCDFLFNNNASNFYFSGNDEDQGLDEGLKHTQSKESPHREETSDGKHHPLLHTVYKLNRNQQLHVLWSCFAFIVRNLDQTMATKYLGLHSQNSRNIWKSSYNALQAQY